MPAQTHTHKAKPAAGFTLIELLVTVAIVGILATIAATSYQSQVMRSRRTEARSAILDLAGREEKLFSTTNAYSNSPVALGYGTAVATFPLPVGNSGTDYYTVTVVTPDTVTQGGAANTYLITATPIAGTQQAADTTCTSLSVNQLGQQTAIPAANAATCWGN
ncbi:MAG: type IV pilin protein [Steroidobacteraceae bacterium]